MSISRIELENGSFVSVNDFGNPDGFPIIVNHGMIASIKDEGFFSSLIEAGRRIICVARPGYGKSSPLALENIGMWGSVVRDVMNKIRVGEFDVLGMSSGAPYSYAIARELGERTRKVYIFSGTPALFHKDVVALWPYPINPEAQIPELQTLAKEIFFPGVVDINADSSVDSYMNDCFGIALDLRIRCVKWGFDLSQIESPVIMEHGLDDESVPYATAKITAGLLGNCSLKTRESGGHFTADLLDQFFRDTVLMR